MHCSVCPHEKEIVKALSACQGCECGCRHTIDQESGRAIATFSGYSAVCKKCQALNEIQEAMRPCASCDETHVRNRVQLTPQTLAYAKKDDHTQMPGVTELHPDVEDALRKALCVIFDFEPVQLLLIQHVVHGRTVATFREPLADLKDRLTNRYDLSEDSTTFRAIAHEWKKKIVAKFPPLADLFDAIPTQTSEDRVATRRSRSRGCDGADNAKDAFASGLGAVDPERLLQFSPLRATPTKAQRGSGNLVVSWSRQVRR